MANFLPFLIILMVIAAALRAHAVMTVFYLLAALFIAAGWWSRRSLKAVSFTRQFTPRAFLNQVVPVELRLKNSGWLPVVWLNLHESLPLDLIVPNFFRRSLSLGPRGEASYAYTLRANKRGYYALGPIFLSTGDLLGLSKENKLQGPPDHLTVYPQIVPLARLGLPSLAPFGTLRHTSPIYEDPSRIKGKREYQVGDSLRRVDWKATATSGRMQVRLYEPSISVETAIFLNLNDEDYEIHQRFDTTELAVVAAASIANWAAERKQPVGLFINALDPLSGQPPQPIPARKGSAGLMSILDVLARAQVSSDAPFDHLLQRSLAGLSWGTTVVIITGRPSERLFDQLFQAQRMGLSTALLLIGHIPGFTELQARARRFGILAHRVRLSSELEALK